MKAVAAALVFAVGNFAANIASAQYPVYESPVVHSQPGASAYALPAYPSYQLPVQTYAAPAYRVYSVPAYTADTTYAPARIGVLGRLMELERRKNAWLRQTFLRRP